MHTHTDFNKFGQFGQFGPFGPVNAERVRRQRGRGRGPMGAGPGWGPWGEFAELAEFFGGGGRGRRGGPRVRRGDVRNAILDVLHAAGEEDLNGYQVIQAIQEKSNGSWKPSPGSVYPTVAQLEDEGLVTVERSGGRKVLRLTPDGVKYVSENAEEVAAVWTAFAETGDRTDRGDLRRVLKQSMGAFGQIMATGTPAQQEQALAILNDARKRLFLILAEDVDSQAEDVD